MIPKHIIEQHQAGQFDDVKAFYEARMQAEPTCASWPALLGILYAQTQDYTEAAALLEQALTLERSADILAQLATVYGHLGLWSKAHNCFDASLSMQAFAPRVHNNRGLVYLKAGQYSEAEAHFLMALTQDGTIQEAYFNLGLCAMHTAHYTEAVRRFQQSLDLAPKHAPSQYQLGLAQELLAQHTEAVVSYRSCLEHMEHPDAAHGLGRCLMKEEAWHEAVNCFQKSLMLGCRDEALWHNLGLCYLQLASPALALEAWLQIPHSARSVDTLYHLGVSYQQLLRYEEASVYFKEVLTQDPIHLDSLMNLIAMSIERFKTEEARTYLEAAMHAHPERLDLMYLHAALSQNDTPKRAPSEYVRQLFDHYAQHYDHHLEYLKYQFPTELVYLLQAYAGPADKSKRILDLGCGSGLCAPALAPYAKELVGVDLSSAMLALAEGRKRYSQLHQMDVLEFIEHETARYGMVVLGDLLPYFGELSFLENLKTLLVPNGLIILSIERSYEQDYHLHEHARFAHHPNYVSKMLHPMHCLHNEAVTLRTQLGNNVSGVVMVFQNS